MNPSGDYSLHDSTGYWVNRLAMAMREALERELAPFGVTPPQWGVLITCFRGQARTPADLARYLCVDGAAVTRLLDHLEAKGLLMRRPHDSDRRSLTIELTSRGREITPQLADISQKVNQRFLAVLSGSEARQFHQLLQKMLQQADARAAKNDSPVVQG